MWQFKINKIKSLMYQKSLTMEEIAKLLDISRVSVINLIHNHHNCRLDKALDLAELLEVSIYDITKKI